MERPGRREKGGIGDASHIYILIGIHRSLPPAECRL